MRDNLNRFAAEQFSQPLLCRLAFRLAQFRCVEAAEPDAFGSDVNRVSVDDDDPLSACKLGVAFPASSTRGGWWVFLVGNEFVGSFGNSVRPAVWRTSWAMGFEGR